jgi:hypothetical protein
MVADPHYSPSCGSQETENPGLVAHDRGCLRHPKRVAAHGMLPRAMQTNIDLVE